MSVPLFSIITVSYNSEKTIARTIESVLHQTYKDYEYIIIDGASTDSTVDIIKSYIDKFDGKLSFVSEKDNGIYDAMNKGISKTNGQLIGIINSDDWYEENTLEILEECYSNNHCRDGVYYGILMNYIDGLPYRATGYHHNYLHEAIISHPSTFISRSIYLAFGLFRNEYRLAADYELMFRLLKNHVCFHFIPKILSNFSLGGSTDKHKLLSELETFKIKREYAYLNTRQYYKATISLRIQYLFISKFKKIFKYLFRV
ncbi:MAG: glycosyltransferase [Candidatus Delongbacteria bacterium]|nr:glycosyltransferase [Candidatus Delongbacteria bacterium]MBN2836851.1 glycosyltransferase [Candidatus Delongbacteria bacterium]